MTEFTPEARARLNVYLADLRHSVELFPRVNAADVERDVRDHIEAALTDHDPPVGCDDLNAVLSALGDPSDWTPDFATGGSAVVVPIEWWREVRRTAETVARQIAGGPESFRLTYLAFALFVLGWGLLIASFDEDFVPFAIFSTLASFVVARAALVAMPDRRPNAAQRWLLYPPLILLYLPLAGSLLLWPAVIGGIAITHSLRVGEARTSRAEAKIRVRETQIAELERQRRAQSEHFGANHPDNVAIQRRIDEATQEIAQIAGPANRERSAFTPRGFQGGVPPGIVTVVSLGVWWVFVGFILWIKIGWITTVFAPFRITHPGRVAVSLMSLGTILLIAPLAFMA